MLNERLPEAIYQWRERTIAVPVPEDPGARLGALLAVADGLGRRRARPRRGRRLSADLGAYGYAAAPVSQGFLSKRNLAIFFGAALVADGRRSSASPSASATRTCPSDDVAVIDDDSINVPGLVEDGKISKANFDRFLLQTAKQSGLQAVPQPSDPQYKQLKDQAMQSGRSRSAGSSARPTSEGLTFTDTQVSSAPADQVAVQDRGRSTRRRATRRA